MTLLLTLLLKSLLLFAVSGLLLFALRRSSAAARSLVCLLTLGAVLALPLCSAVLPGWQMLPAAALPSQPVGAPLAVPSSPSMPPPSGTPAKSPLASSISSSGKESAEGAANSAPTPVISAPPLLGAGGPLLLFFLLGFLLAAARPLLGLWGIRRLSRACTEIDDAQTLILAADCVRLLGLKTPPRLCTATVPVPMTWGWRRPVIALPNAFAEWPEDRLRSVLLHEMAHIKRRDWPAHRLADFACAVYWFHPLVWLTARRLRSETETACDDLVLAAGIPAPDYARHLLEIASALPCMSKRSHTAIAMAQTSKIESRLTMILDKTRPRRAVARRVLVFALIPATAALITLAVLRPEAKAQTASAAQSLPEPQVTYFPLSDQKKKLRLAQAHQLRDHLAGWAGTNKAAILQMQQAQPDDFAALMQVYRSLNTQPFPLWSGDPRSGRGEAMPAFSSQTASMTLTHLQRSREPIFEHIRQDFADFRDVRISRSIDVGNVCIVIWASGRITESTTTEKFMGHGKPFLEVESQKVLMPAFFPSAHDAKIGELIRYSIPH